MSEQSWTPMFRTPKSTITKVLQSPAFVTSREQSGVIIDDPVALRALAGAVEALDHENAPLSAIADRVAAALRFLRSKAHAHETGADVPVSSAVIPRDSEVHSAAGSAARERLIIAALHYLITPDDLVPDFRSGGYIDDVLVLTWVFGAAVHELEPFLDPDT